MYKNVVTLRKELRNISLSGCGAARWQSLELILKVVSRHCMATVKRIMRSCFFLILYNCAFVEKNNNHDK